MPILKWGFTLTMSRDQIINDNDIKPIILGIIALKSDQIKSSNVFNRIFNDGLDFEVINPNKSDIDSQFKSYEFQIVICYLPFNQAELDYSIRHKINKFVKRAIKFFIRRNIINIVCSNSCRSIFTSNILTANICRDENFGNYFTNKTDKFNDIRDRSMLEVKKESKIKKSHDYRDNEIYDTYDFDNFPLNQTITSRPFCDLSTYKNINLFDGRSIFINCIHRTINILSNIKNTDSRICSLTIIDEEFSDITEKLVKTLINEFRRIRITTFNMHRADDLVNNLLENSGLVIELERDFTRIIDSDYAIIVSNDFCLNPIELSKSTIVVDLFASYMGQNIAIDNLKIEMPIKNLPLDINSLDLIESLIGCGVNCDINKLVIKALNRNTVSVPLNS